MNYPKENEAGTESSRSTSSTSHWSSNKNPRIVRVSRNFGGKDRHSKVATIRGLRDRRIRLSVPTAIQLYDLQERLGLSQPSKAVDWLLDVAKEDIEGLPPLPMIPGILPLPDIHQYQFSSSVGPTNNYNHDYNWGQAHRNSSSLSLSQFGGGLSVITPPRPPQTEDHVPLSSGTSAHEMYYPSSSASGLPSFFPPFFSQYTPAASMEINDHLRQINFLEDN